MKKHRCGKQILNFFGMIAQFVMSCITHEYEMALSGAWKRHGMKMTMMHLKELCTRIKSRWQAINSNSKLRRGLNVKSYLRPLVKLFHVVAFLWETQTCVGSKIKNVNHRGIVSK